jgi:hypothetical protein
MVVAYVIDYFKRFTRMPIIKQCHNCKTEYKIKPAEAEKSKFCSNKCKWDFNGWSSEPNTECTFCKNKFRMPESAKKRYKRTDGYFCSNSCLAEHRKESYKGSKNPNYKAAETDHDGYLTVNRVNAKDSNRFSNVMERKLHRAVCAESLGVLKISGFVVHHRDCDIKNNTEENLAVMNESDHRWIHKQYGNATLWAFMNNKISLSDLVSWSDDKERSEKLLTLCVKNQDARVIGVVIKGILMPQLKDSDRGTRGINDSELRLR